MKTLAVILLIISVSQIPVKPKKKKKAPPKPVPFGFIMPPEFIEPPPLPQKPPSYQSENCDNVRLEDGTLVEPYVIDRVWSTVWQRCDDVI